MRILYDGQMYSWQAAGGINRYFANIIGRLPESFRPSLLVELVREVNYPQHKNLRLYQLGKMRFENVSYRLSLYLSMVEDYYKRNIASLQRFDLAHPTYYRLVSRREIKDYRCPVVLTVWDMIHEVFPAEMDPTGQEAEEKRRALLAAQAIICISENTKKDLLERYPVPEDRVRVTHLASEIDASLAHGPEPTPARPYYLYVGSRSPYKNFGGLLAALAKVVSIRPELSLCVVGGPFKEAEARLIADLRLFGHVEHYGNVGDGHLAKLYRHSIAFVYPSLYEGFGIPPVEAMACGGVVVASNRSSLPEVIGDAGILFDPASIDDLADILLSLPDDSTTRTRLIEKGRQRAGLYSWEKTVAQTLDVYRSVSS